MGKKAQSEPSKPPTEDSAAPSDMPQPQSGEVVPSPVAASPQPDAEDLPLVEAPMLDAGEAFDQPAIAAADDSDNVGAPEATAAPDAEATAEMPSEPAAASTAQRVPAPQPRSFRFALLAATIALAAGVGSFLGSLTASGVFRTSPAEVPIARTADARDVIQALKAQLNELSVLRANLDGVSRSVSTQFTKMAERLDRIERAEADPATLARIADSVDRLEKRTSAPETTGSLASPAPATPAPAAQPALTGRILDNWIVQDVRNGQAVVESIYGAVFVVSAGSVIPGLGPVESVKRQNGHWIVVTARGLITSEQ